MRKFLPRMLAVALLLCVLILSGCDVTSFDPNTGSPTIPFFDDQKFQVTFVYDNDTPDKTVLIEKGKTVATPADPEKENYLFRGWYTDSACTHRYDFARSVTKDLTLYAKYEIDAITLTNKITTDTVTGVVKVYNKNYNSFLGFETASATSQGSGFCFHIQDGCYYILTNCHVAVKKAGYDHQQFTIEDYQGKTYEGYLLKSANKAMNAIAAQYDLACLYFKPASATNVQALSIVENDPELGTDVISIGAPDGQANSITYGKIQDYGKVTVSDASASESDVTFDVIGHDAYINNGSSGGPLLDAQCNVIGVNYAGSKSANFSAAIPAEKVNEFLHTYVYG